MRRPAIDSLFEQFFNWRCELSRELYLLRGWLEEQKLAGPGLDGKIPHLLQKLEDERITVAIVAEYSRGKTELINAMFFADHGRRLLPSGAGATTMCPTEVLYDATLPPGLRLLPIESLETPGRLHELKQDWSGWTVIDFDMANPDSISDACLRLSETQMVPAETAERYALYDPRSGDSAMVQDGCIEIPRWRHALFNFLKIFTHLNSTFFSQIRKGLHARLLILLTCALIHHKIQAVAHNHRKLDGASRYPHSAKKTPCMYRA